MILRQPLSQVCSTTMLVVLANTQTETKLMLTWVLLCGLNLVMRKYNMTVKNKSSDQSAHLCT